MRSPAKGVGSERGLEGSNPSVSATSALTRGVTDAGDLPCDKGHPIVGAFVTCLAGVNA